MVSRRSPRRAIRRVALATVLAGFAATRPLYAHAIGVSRGEYTARGGTVTVTLLFARSEIAAAWPELDVDRDGTLSTQELRSGRGVIDEGIVQQIRVSGAAGCAGTMNEVAPIEGDGLSIRATIRCAPVPPTLALSLGFLDRLTVGHRHFFSVGGGDASSVAYSGNAEIQLLDTSIGSGLRAVGRALFRFGMLHSLTGYDQLVFPCAVLLIGGAGVRVYWRSSRISHKRVAGSSGRS